MRLLKLLGLLLPATSVLAAESGGVPEPFGAEAMLQLLLGLALVIGLILALAWVARRFMGIAPQQGKMKVLAGLPLGSREKALLVQVGDRQLLLGVAPGRVNLLLQFDEPVVDVAESDPFASRLKEAIRQRASR